jgi:uncharacterized membrane protein YbhN (UPF0104 family)
LGFRVIAAALLVVLIVRLVDWRAASEALAGLDTGACLGAAAATMLISLLEALRLKLMFSESSIRYRDAVELQVVGSAFGNITPAQVGSDVFKATRLADAGYKPATLAVRLLMLRFFAVVVLAIGACIGFGFNASALLEPIVAGIAMPPVWPYVGATGIVVAGSYLARRYLGLVREHWPGASRTSAVVLVSFGMLLPRTAVLLLLCRAVAVDLPITGALFIATCSILAMLAPISVAGLGVREGVIVVCLAAFGAGSGAGAVVAVLGRLLMLAQSMVGATWWLLTQLRRRTSFE